MKPILMSTWSERFGSIQDVKDFEGHVIAQIGKIHVVFPVELSQKLHSLIGVRVAILRTDIEGKEFLFRALSDHDMESAAETVEAIATETNTHQHNPEGV